LIKKQLERLKFTGPVLQGSPSRPELRFGMQREVIIAQTSGYTKKQQFKKPKLPDWRFDGLPAAGASLRHAA
jgi:hypothetical protein